MVDFYNFGVPTLEIQGKAKDAKKYMNLPCAVIEFNIRKFESWYQPFDFATAIPKMENDDWILRIVMLFPHLLSQPEKSQEGVRTRPKGETELQFMKYRGIVHRLYSKMFEAEDDYLDEAMSVDPTIMLLAYKKPSRSMSLHGKALCDVQSGIKIVTAVTFRPSSFERPGPAFITWLAVNATSSTAPKCLSSWRRRGFATFMIVHVIKFCASRQPNETTLRDTKTNDILDATGRGSLSIYLQCSTEDATFQFYRRLGFQHINKDLDNDGIAMLPTSLMESLANPDDLAFRHYDPVSAERRLPNLGHAEDSRRACRLMQLFPGGLQIAERLEFHRDVDGDLHIPDGEVDGGNVQSHRGNVQSHQELSTWCRLPMYLSAVPRCKRFCRFRFRRI